MSPRAYKNSSTENVFIGPNKTSRSVYALACGRIYPAAFHVLFHGSDRRKSSCGFSYAPIKNGQNPLIFYAFPYCIPPSLLPDSFCMHGRQKSVKELFFTFTVPQSFFVSIIRPCFVLPLPRLFSPALSFPSPMRSFPFSRSPLFLALSLSSFLVFSPVYPPLLTYISFLTPSQTFACLVYVSPSLPLLLFRFFPRPLLSVFFSRFSSSSIPFRFHSPYLSPRVFRFSFPP